MADEMEEIEARLAAYVDGTLPTAQRAEIEAYLKANPVHGKLITELQWIKSAVKNLPQEKAPAEVLDTLQSHLERRTLLDDSEEAAGPRINRWPQLGAVAAVLLLAGGLGILVYQVLPGEHAGNNELAILSSSASRSVGPGDGSGVTLDDTPVPRAAKSLADSETVVLPKPAAPPPTPPTQTAAASLRPAQQARRQSAVESSDPPAAGAAGGPAGVQRFTSVASIGAAEAGATANNTSSAMSADDSRVSDPVRAVVLRTDDPAVTLNLLAASLTQDGVAFEVVPWPTNAPAAGQAGVPAEAVGPQAAALSAASISLADVVRQVHQAGEVPAADQDNPQAAVARAIIIRGVGRDRALRLVQTGNEQRPGHQRARFALEENGSVRQTRIDDAIARQIDASPTQPATDADEPKRVGPLIVEQSQPWPVPRLLGPEASVAASGPANSPATSPTRADVRADVVVLIVPESPATAPAATAASVVPSATTAPSASENRPATLPIDNIRPNRTGAAR